MENFNTKEYRNNLARDLKEIRKTDPEKAQEVLVEAQETKEYNRAKKNHQEGEKKIGELDYVPVFRENKLYNAMFPDIVPLFKIGEEPEAKIILNEILKHINSKVTLDGTCYDAVYGYKKLTKDDFPNDTNFKYFDDGGINFRDTLDDVFKKKGIKISHLDSVVSSSLERGNEYERLFDDIDAGEVVSLIKDQVPEVNRVVLAIANIGDHTGDITEAKGFLYLDIPADQKEEIITKAKIFLESNLFLEKMKELDTLLEKTEVIKHCRSSEFKDKKKKGADAEGKTIEEFVDDIIKIEKKSLLFPLIILSEKIKLELGIEPEFVVDDLNNISPINEKTVIVLDRHNNLVRQMINPRQKILLPLSSGIEHAQSLGVLKNSDGDFAMKLRKNFEKK